MPSFTLHYFNQRGRAEVCRMLFAASAVQYNDHRVENSEWSSFKSKVPCNQLPMLEIDNKIQIPQSMAIARYLAREFGFHGKTNIEMARVDFISDCFYDVLDDYLRMYQDKEGRMTSENYMRYQDTLYRILPYMEKTLEAYNNGSHYFMGEQLTVADLMFYCALENPLMEDSSMLNSYPKLQALKNRILNNSKISPYLKKRAKTEF